MVKAEHYPKPQHPCRASLWGFKLMPSCCTEADLLRLQELCASQSSALCIPSHRMMCYAMSQVVSLHCALDDKTKHLINADRLKLMKKDAILVNAARGPVHDEVALVEHLQNNPEFRSPPQMREYQLHVIAR